MGIFDNLLNTKNSVTLSEAQAYKSYDDFNLKGQKPLMPTSQSAQDQSTVTTTPPERGFWDSIKDTASGALHSVKQKVGLEAAPENHQARGGITYSHRDGTVETFKTQGAHGSGEWKKAAHQAQEAVAGMKHLGDMKGVSVDTHGAPAATAVIGGNSKDRTPG